MNKIKHNFDNNSWNWVVKSRVQFLIHIFINFFNKLLKIYVLTFT